MMPAFDLIMSPLVASDEVEVVEHKGGRASEHDLQCAGKDLLNLCREYLY